MFYLKRINTQDLKKTCLSAFFSIALTIAFQNISGVLITFINICMVGNINTSNVAAIGSAGTMLYILNLFLYGIGTGSSIFCVRYWGKRDLANVRKTALLSMEMGITIALIMSVLTFFFAVEIMTVFSKDKNIIELGSQFLKIISSGLIFISISSSITFTLRCVGKAYFSIFTGLGAVAINFLLGWGLIYGNFGVHFQGIQGAAVGIVATKILECLANVFLVYYYKCPIAITLKDFFNPLKRRNTLFYTRIVVVTLNDLLWGLGNIVYFIIYGHMGAGNLAIMTIIQSVDQLVLVVFVAVANTAAIFIGNSIGTETREQVIQSGKSHFLVAFYTGLFSMVILVIFIPLIKMNYHLAGDIWGLVYGNILLLALFLPLKSINLMFVDGIFRGGGDTKFIFFADAGILWIFGIPTALLLGLYMNLNIRFVFFGVLFVEIIKFMITSKHFYSNKWIKKLRPV